MYISNETKEQTEKRLVKVLKTATFKIFEESYFFKETQITDFHFELNALAMVKDNEVWSYLIPSESEKTENFKIFSFHFKDGLDNSGFVGWLASKIKTNWVLGYSLSVGRTQRKGGGLIIGVVQLK